MKKFKFLAMVLSVALSAGFTACGDDDDDNGGSINGGNVDTSKVPANAVYTSQAGNNSSGRRCKRTFFCGKIYNGAVKSKTKRCRSVKLCTAFSIL